MNYKTKQIGTFEVISTLLVVTDPCYLNGENGRTHIQVTPGTWEAEVQIEKIHDEETPVVLIVKKEGHTLRDEWEKVGEAGVDSGQMSISCNDAVGYLRLNGKAFERFYNDCSKITLSNDPAGVFHRTAVCVSGYGDGTYDIEVQRAGRDVVAVRISFLELSEPSVW